MKYYLIVILAFLSMQSHGQDLKKLDLKYIEIVSIPKKIQEYYLVIDHGQGINYKKAVFVMDESGQKKPFTGTTQILNYMDKQGWDYIDRFIDSSGGTTVRRYIFKKKEA